MTEVVTSKIKTLKAVSLVEVLIVLALVATTMVAATQVTVTSLVRIKENEIDDYVNGLMIQSLEAIKNPQTLTVDNSLTGQTQFLGSYVLSVPKSNESNTNTVLPSLRLQNPALDKIKASDCSDTSPNYVSIPNLGNYAAPAVCMQALVQPVPGIKVAPIYQVTVRAVYKLSSGLVERELVGYRRVDPTTTTLPVAAPVAPPSANLPTLTLLYVGNGSGTVTGSDNQTCTKSCTLNIPSGTNYSLTVAPATKSGFVSWGYDCNASGNVTISGNKTCIVNFCGESVAATSAITLPVSTNPIYTIMSGLTVNATVKALVIHNVTGTTTGNRGVLSLFNTAGNGNALPLAFLVRAVAPNPNTFPLAGTPTGTFLPDDNAITAVGERINLPPTVSGSVFVAYSDTNYADNLGNYRVTIDTIKCQ